MNYYESARPGLGDRFLSAVARVVENARMLPTSFPIFDDDCRKAGLRRFPYSVVYRIRDGEMQIVSVLHSMKGSRVHSKSLVAARTGYISFCQNDC